MSSNRSRLVDEVGDRLRQVLEASPAKDLERNVRAVLGSVADQVVRESHLPVLLVRPTEPAS